MAGTLSAIVEILTAMTSSPQFSGSGLLSAGAYESYAQLTPLSGGGLLSTAIWESYMMPGGLAGSGSLTATLMAMYFRNANLAAAGALACLANELYGSVGALGGGGSLSATASAVVNLDIVPKSQATAEATTLTMPSHATGDLLLMFVFRDGSTTAPTIPGGWTAVATPVAANTCWAGLYSKEAASGAETSGTWTSATLLQCVVYDNHLGIGAVASQSGSSATITYPALTMLNTSGTSWVLGFGAHRSINASMNVAPAGMTNRVNLEGALADAASFDTNGGVASWTSKNAVTTETASGYATFVVELAPEDLMTVEKIDVVTKPVPAGITGVWVSMLGAGRTGGAGPGSSTAANGGTGGTGGSKVGRSFVPVADLGGTYSLTRAKASGADSTFVSGSCTLTAQGGQAAAGGVASQAGTTGQTLVNGSAAGGSNTGGAGSGGGHGSNINGSGNGAGGVTAGGSTTGGGTGGGTNGGAGGARVGSNAGGGGGGGGTGSGSQNIALPGGAGGDGSGGGGGAATTAGAGGSPGGAFGPGYTKLEWV